MFSIGRAVVITPINMSLWKEGKGSQCPQDPHKAPLPDDMWYVIGQGQSLEVYAQGSHQQCESSVLPRGLHSDAVSCESEMPTV